MAKEQSDAEKKNVKHKYFMFNILYAPQISDRPFFELYKHYY